MTPSDSQRDLRAAPAFHPEPDVAALYAAHAALVRRSLARLGVQACDLDDVSQEVFLLLYDKRQQLTEVSQLEAWLREVCRRVAASHRRRAYRQREISAPDLSEGVNDEALLPGELLEQSQDEEQLHRALGELDEEARDLVALHQLGNLPLVDVAELVDQDRKTVRKKLEAALRRLGVLLRERDGLAQPLLRAEPPPAPLCRPALEPVPQRSTASDFQLLAATPTLKLGRVGPVLVSIWPGPATVEALELIEAQFARFAQLGGSFAYLTVVEAATRPPALAARQKIVSVLKQYSSHVSVYATVMLGGAAWIALPIMTGLAKLARFPTPMQFFNGIEPAARWVAERHALPAAAISDCAERLRRC